MVTMPELVIAFCLITSAFIGVASLLDMLYFKRETAKEEENGKCECRTPSEGSVTFGASFVCDMCARKWYYTHDNVAWSGWVWAPWWKRWQISLGWDNRRYEDPVSPSKVESKLKRENNDR